MHKVLFLLPVGVAVALAAGPVSWQGGTDGGTLVLELPAPTFSDLTVAAGDFVFLELPGAGLSDIVGAPGLPVYRRLVEVPHGAAVELAVGFDAVETYRTEQRLAPRQPPIPKTGPAPEFAFDDKVYALDDWYGTVGARVVEVGTMRGHRLVLVEVMPARHNPVAGLLELARRVEVEVRWTGADWHRTRTLGARYDNPAFRTRLAGVTVNHGEFGLAPPPDLPVGFLIIVPDDWEEAVRPLAEWRRRMGYHVFVHTLSRVGGGDANTVRNYLRHAYDIWPVPPGFVLLVGDVDRIGHFVGQGTSNPPTDLNFALLDGDDYLPDIDLSRASVATMAQLDSLVHNIVTYEQAAGSAGTNWLNRAYFIASNDRDYHHITERTHAYAMQKLRGYGVECDSLWLYYNSGTPIPAAVNSGRSWVTYSGHGSKTSWADGNFRVQDVRNLTNVDMVPYVQTYACVSGDYTLDECFSEAWIRTGRRGGLAHIASSVNSYWTEDDTLQRRVFDCMFDSSFHWIMGGFNRARLLFLGEMGHSNMTRAYFEMYNLMGDGAIDVYAREPQALTVSYPAVIPLGRYQLPVRVHSGDMPVDRALVGVTALYDPTLFASGYTDSAGTVTLEVNATLPDSVFVTVTGHNLEPHLGACLALPSAGPYVIYLRHTVDDSAGGNDDGIINPGETINLPLWVKNWGADPATGVECRLRTHDPAVTLTDSVRLFGTVEPGDSTGTGRSGFGFTVADRCTNDHALEFTVHVSAACSSAWETTLALPVGAPVLEYAEHEVLDLPPGGNGNGMLEPDETAHLVVVLSNHGRGVASGVTAQLRSGDSRLVVLDSSASFGAIGRDSLGSNASDPFRVRAENTLPRETRVPCTLVISAGAQTWTRVFDLDIGIIRTRDPVPDNADPPQYYAYDRTDTLYGEAPVFDWLDIAKLGTRLPITRDDETVRLNLPPAFGPFYFYGRRFTHLSVCGNGFVAPGSTTRTDFRTTRLPSTNTATMLALLWTDLYPPASGGVWWYHDEPGRRFIIQFDSMPVWENRDVFDWFQLVIHDTTLAAPDGNSVFTYQYLTAHNYGSATVGINDSTTGIGIDYVHNGEYHRGAAALEPGMAIRFTTAGPRVGLADGLRAGPPPARTMLAMPRPNPMRGPVRLSFTLARTQDVRLAIYDATGRRVRELYRDRARAGRYTLNWDGRDDFGRLVGRGVYVCRLDAGDGPMVRKLVKIE